MKQYKAIFFDWDGTAVLSRTAPVDGVTRPMEALLKKGVKLCVISGTTYDKIAAGGIGDRFSPDCRQNLYLGLARGAHNFGFDGDGERVLLGGVLPDGQTMAKVHRACFELHMELFEKYKFNTDIVFDRPNYCKIDLLASVDRGGQLYFQEDEAEKLGTALAEKGFSGGLRGLIHLAEEIGSRHGLSIKATTDAKYLEVGLSTKSDNADFLLERLGFSAEECCFWGDEFLEIGDSIFGSDSFMITDKTRLGDFFDVSDVDGRRPEPVTHVGGGVEQFRQFLEEQESFN